MTREENKQKTDLAEKRELFQKTPKTKPNPNQTPKNRSPQQQQQQKPRKNFALECMDASLSFDRSLSTVTGTRSIWRGRVFGVRAAVRTSQIRPIIN